MLPLFSTEQILNVTKRTADLLHLQESLYIILSKFLQMFLPLPFINVIEREPTRRLVNYNAKLFILLERHLVQVLTLTVVHNIVSEKFPIDTFKNYMVS